MKSVSRTYSLLACVIGACAPTLGFIELAGCGDDNGGPSTTMPDAALDGTIPDGSLEAGPSGDAGHDATTDAKDATPGIDASDAGKTDADAGSDADAGFTCSIPVPDAGVGMPQAIAQVVCGRWEGSCGLDGSTFNENLCLQVYGTGSGWLQVSAAAAFLDAGRITYDPVSACQCLELNSQLQQGLIDQAGLTAIEGACFSALRGTSPLGDGGCTSSYECVPGAFCKGYAPADGGLGTCTALESDGGSCATNDMCNYVGTGTRALYCNGTTCVPTLEAGAGCTVNAQCGSNICINPSCQAGFAFGSPSVCDALTTDAGGGGG